MNLLLRIGVSLIAVKSRDVLINFSSSVFLFFLRYGRHMKCLFLENINVRLMYIGDVLPSAVLLSDLNVSVCPEGRTERRTVWKSVFLGLAIGEAVGVASSVIHSTG